MSGKASSSPFGAQLAASSAVTASLEEQMEAARREGERLRELMAAQELSEAAEAAPDAEAADYATLLAEADAALAPSEGAPTTPAPAPTTAELLALASGGPAPLETARARTCSVCREDPYELRTQLVPCTACGAPAHAACAGLRAIPFRGTSKTDRANRELFVLAPRGYFSEKSRRRRGHDVENLFETGARLR